MLVVCSVILFNSSIVFVLQSYNKIMNTQKDLRVKLQRNRNIKGLSMLKALQALGLKRMSCSFERQANWFVHSHPILTIWGILLYIDGDVGIFVIEHPKMLCTIHLRITVRRHPHDFLFRLQSYKLYAIFQYKISPNVFLGEIFILFYFCY